MTARRWRGVRPAHLGRAWRLLARTYPADVFAVLRSYRTSAVPDPGLRVAVARCARFVRRMDRASREGAR